MCIGFASFRFSGVGLPRQALCREKIRVPIRSLDSSKKSERESKTITINCRPPRHENMKTAKRNSSSGQNETPKESTQVQHIQIYGTATRVTSRRKASDKEQQQEREVNYE